MLTNIKKYDFDAVVVGAGPNGLAAAITLQRQGLSVLIVEAKSTVGGGLRSAELTLPGFTHDICSAIHPLAVASPFLSQLPLAAHGLEFIHPTFAAAHPFDNGTAAIAEHSLEKTAARLGKDEATYLKLIGSIKNDWEKIAPDLLGPLSFPAHPVPFAKFGLNAILSANSLAGKFVTPEARGLWAGMAGHSLQPFSNIASAAIGLVLLTAAHLKGWPFPKGGSQQLANAMASYFISLGGKIETGIEVKTLEQLPSSKAVLLDVTPRQLLSIAGRRFSSLYEWQLKRYRYGMGVFKIDWALGSPIPFTAHEVRGAGTVHLGNSLEEIAAGEQGTWDGKHATHPYVLLAQQSAFDATRAPQGKHTAWAYCHVPNGSSRDMTQIIEDQVERFAPGFRKNIIARHTYNTSQLEEHNPNYIGGDINGGAIDIGQLFTRPALRLSPYRTSAKGIYICSSSTPPGGGVHGMCGHHAALKALKDIFKTVPL